MCAQMHKEETPEELTAPPRGLDRVSEKEEETGNSKTPASQKKDM